MCVMNRDGDGFMFCGFNFTWIFSSINGSDNEFIPVLLPKINRETMGTISGEQIVIICGSINKNDHEIGGVSKVKNDQHIKIK